MPRPVLQPSPKRYRASRLIAQFAKFAGLSEAQFCSAANLPKGAATSLAPEQFLRAWAAYEALSSQSLDLTVMQADWLSHFRADTYAFSCCGTLRQGFERLVAMRPISSPHHLYLEERDTFRISLQCDTGDVPSALRYRELFQLVALVRIATNHRVDPVSITSTQDHRLNGELQDHLGIEVTQSDWCGIELSISDAETPIGSSAKVLLAPFQEPISDLALDSTQHLVSAALKTLLPSGDATIEAAAARLNATVRTLQRRLAVEGTSFAKVLEDTRRSLAEQYLKSQDIRVEEISMLLGYRDPNSFYRAFQSWTGITPRRLRNMLG